MFVRIVGHSRELVLKTGPSYRLISTAQSVSSIALEKKNVEFDEDFPHAVKVKEYIQEENSRVEVQNVSTVTQPVYDGKWSQIKRASITKQFNTLLRRFEAKNSPESTLLKSMSESMIQAASTRRPKYCLVDPESCNKLCQNLGEINSPSTSVVLNNPGAGILTKALLRHGAKSIVFFEPHPLVRKQLMENVHKVDPVFVSDMHATKSSGLEGNHHFNSMVLDANEITDVKFILTVSNRRELYELVHSYYSNNILLNKKNVELYVIANKVLSNRILANRTTSYKSIADWWKITFVSEEVCTIPAKAFFPEFRLDYHSSHYNNKSDAVVMRVKLQSHMTSDGRYVSEEERPFFALFFRLVIIAHSAPVIPFLEKWAPGIGLKLIGPNLSIWTKFVELSSEDFVKVFFILFEHYAPAGSPVWEIITDYIVPIEKRLSLKVF